MQSVNKYPPRNEQQTPKVRDNRLDAVKFWLIFLVISIHVMMRKEFADISVCNVLHNWANLFVMPLFIFISGYTSTKKRTKDFWLSIWKLLEPLIIFHVIALVFFVKHPLTLGRFLSPWFMLWYLLCLIYWRFMLQILPESILKHKIIVLVSTFIISIMAGFTPLNRILSLQRALSLMPFFLLGYYMKGRNLFLPDKYKTYCFVFLVMILAILSFYHHRISYLLYATPYKSNYGAVIRVAAFAVSIPMSLAFMKVCNKSSWVAKQGRMTMQYYVYHAFIILPNSALFTPPLIAVASAMNIPMNIVTVVVVILVTTLIIAMALKIPYFKMLTNPSSFFITRNR